jgi:hypothetical protein
MIQGTIIMNDNYILIDAFAKQNNIDLNKLKQIIIKYKDYTRNSNNDIYIKSSFIDVYNSLFNTTEQEKETQETANETDRLFKIIDDLNNQIAIKDKMIKDLQDKLLQFTETAQEIASKSLQLQEQRNYIEAQEKANKQSWFKKIFNRKRIDD